MKGCKPNTEDPAQPIESSESTVPKGEPSHLVEPLQENPVFSYVSAGGANNVIVGFNVDDVDTEYNRLLPLDVEMLNQPTTHPWGARSFQFKDPDGNILNFRSFTLHP